MIGIQGFGIAVLCILIALLSANLPMWLSLGSMLIVLWKFTIIKTHQGQPPRFLVFLIACVFLTSLILEGGSFRSRDSIIAITCIISVVICLDKQHPRQVVLAHSGFFAMLVALLVSRQIQLNPLVYLGLAVLIFLSLAAHHVKHPSLRTLLPIGSNSIKLAIPISAVLLPVYFFFPEVRIPSNSRGLSGSSDLLEPGKIAELALSNKLAFRARFQNDFPDRDSLFWRAQVLEESYGMTWRKGRSRTEEILVQKEQTEPYSYQVFPEAMGTLSLPLLENSYNLKSEDAETEKIWWIPDLRVYKSQAALIAAAYRPETKTKDSLASAPNLKIQISARTQDLVDQLKKMKPLDQLDFLRDLAKNFSYSLNPGKLLSDDILDEFLFVRKLGYCEHFSAAFATLLQLAGTPARVVTGYQGGTRIAGSQFLVVRERDAHAWIEVYLNDGWQRWDPTEFIRVQDPMESSNLSLFALPLAWIAYSVRISIIQIRDLLRHFEGVWLTCAALLVGALVFQTIRLRKRVSRAFLWQAAYDELTQLLQSRGFELRKNIGTKTFLEASSIHFPEHSQLFQSICNDYIEQVYGASQDQRQAHSLQKNMKLLISLIKKSKLSR